MGYYAYSFETDVATLRYDPYSYTVLFVPAHLDETLPLAQYPRLRIEGEIGEHPFNAAIIPSQQGRHIILSRELLRDAGLRLGDRVEVRFNIADQQAVVVPEELELALDASPEARSAWEDLTPGRRRGLAHLVGKLKAEASRQRKADDLVALLRNGGQLPGPPSRGTRR